MPTTRYVRRKQLGLCVYCPELALLNRVLCARCAARTRQTRRASYAHRKQLGLCVSCEAPPEPGSVYCAGCLADRRQRMATARAKATP